MDAITLDQLVDQRHETLTELLKISQHQIDAIETNRMSDLMKILSEKQKTIQRLADLSQRLKPALADNPQTRDWPSESQRDRCRTRQQQCDQMHAELMQIEATCEATLQANRTDMTGRLERLSSGTDATSGYAQAQQFSPTAGPENTGSQLDFSE